MDGGSEDTSSFSTRSSSSRCTRIISDAHTKTVKRFAQDTRALSKDEPMTRQEYKSFREEQAALDLVRKYIGMFDEFLFEYPAFKDMTAKECFDYFSQRQASRMVPGPKHRNARKVDRNRQCACILEPDLPFTSGEANPFNPEACIAECRTYYAIVASRRHSLRPILW